LCSFIFHCITRIHTHNFSSMLLGSLPDTLTTSPPVFLHWHKSGPFQATLAILVLSPIGLLGFVGQPVGTSKLFLHFYWSILFYGSAKGNWRVVLHFPI
jgi:hypothetical protein